MRYLLQNSRIYFCLLLCFLQAQGLKYNPFSKTPVLDEINIIDNETSYILKLEFSGTNFDYVTNENFAPPSLSLIFNNVKWEKGNFTKKSEQSPLYQYSISIPRSVNQNELNNKLKLKLDFTRVPEYKLKLKPLRGNNKKQVLEISWAKNNVKKPNKRYPVSTKRLPPSRVSLSFQNAKLINVVRMLVSEDNLNLIMGEDLSGRVTVNLDDVSLETALDAILHVNNYEWFVQDNIIIVQPMTTKKVMSGELLTRMFRLNYVGGTIASEAVREVISRAVSGQLG